MPEDGLGNLITSLYFSSAKPIKEPFSLIQTPCSVYENQAWNRLRKFLHPSVWTHRQRRVFMLMPMILYICCRGKGLQIEPPVPLSESTQMSWQCDLYSQKDLSKKAIYRLMQLVTFQSRLHQSAESYVAHIPRFKCVWDDEHYLILPLGVLEDVLGTLWKEWL